MGSEGWEKQEAGPYRLHLSPARQRDRSLLTAYPVGQSESECGARLCSGQASPPAHHARRRVYQLPADDAVVEPPPIEGLHNTVTADSKE